LAKQAEAYDGLLHVLNINIQEKDVMNVILLKALIAFVPAGMLCAGSFILFSTRKSVWSLLQVVGAMCFMVVILAHICEALHLFPAMQWGMEHSVGHYIDLWSVILGLTLFPVGYLLHTLAR
jgi:hypothetical protein